MSGMRQKIQYSLALEPVDQGENPDQRLSRDRTIRGRNQHPKARLPPEQLMEEVCDRENLVRAWKRVRRNKGSPWRGWG